MAFNKDQFAERITAIGTCEDDSERRTLLAGLQEECDLLFDDRESLKDTNEKLETKNKNLQAYNMDLFLQIGNKRKPEENQPGGQSEERLKYEDLFDDKGGIK